MKRKSQRSHQPATCAPESRSNDQCDGQSKLYKSYMTLVKHAFNPKITKLWSQNLEAIQAFLDL